MAPIRPARLEVPWTAEARMPMAPRVSRAIPSSRSPVAPPLVVVHRRAFLAAMARGLRAGSRPGPVTRRAAT